MNASQSWFLIRKTVMKIIRSMPHTLFSKLDCYNTFRSVCYRSREYFGALCSRHLRFCSFSLTLCHTSSERRATLTTFGINFEVFAKWNVYREQKDNARSSRTIFSSQRITDNGRDMALQRRTNCTPSQEMVEDIYIAIREDHSSSSSSSDFELLKSTLLCLEKRLCGREARRWNRTRA